MAYVHVSDPDISVCYTDNARAHIHISESDHIPPLHCHVHRHFPPGFPQEPPNSHPAPALVPTFRSSRRSQRCHSAPSSKARPRSLASCCSSSGHTDAAGRRIPAPSGSRPCCPLPLHVSLCYAERLSPPSTHTSCALAQPGGLP